jgi:uncharacterized LabA/DUF88 family protein
MSQTESKIALLIDADNAPASKIDVILAEIAKYGVANIRRAYGNWKNPSLKSWEDCLHEYAIQPIQQFDYTKGKNATDAALIIDAMDLLYTQKLDAFAIISSDCDFTPFVSACSTFLYLETLTPSDEDSNGVQIQPKSGRELKQDTKLMNLLRGAIANTQDEDGWSKLGLIGGHIKNQASFDARNYGYEKLSNLFEAIDLFEIKREKNFISVRSKPKK